MRATWLALPTLILVAGACVAQEAGVQQANPAVPQADEAQAIADAKPLRLVLPPDMYAVPGHEISIYFDNIMLTPNISNYCIDVTCNRGRQDADRWRYIPAPEDVGQFGLTVQVLDAATRLIEEASTMIHVVPADAGAGKQVSILNIGDSLTNAGYISGGLYTLCQAEANPVLKMVGDRKGSVEGAWHQGYGGWTWLAFCTRWTEGTDDRAKSPFLRLEGDKAVLDFQAYCERLNDGKAPDFVTVLLGCNDTFGATEETIEERIDSMFLYADMLLAELRRVGPDTQIGILLLVPPAASQDAFGSNYRCGQTRWQYRRNVQRVVERQLEKFGGREAENIFIIPANVNLDCANNYPAQSEPANSRNETKVLRQSNGVHPAATGYCQIADSIYYWLKWRLSR